VGFNVIMKRNKLYVTLSLGILTYLSLIGITVGLTSSNIGFNNLILASEDPDIDSSKLNHDNPTITSSSVMISREEDGSDNSNTPPRRNIPSPPLSQSRSPISRNPVSTSARSWTSPNTRRRTTEVTSNSFGTRVNPLTRGQPSRNTLRNISPSSSRSSMAAGTASSSSLSSFNNRLPSSSSSKSSSSQQIQSEDSLGSSSPSSSTSSSSSSSSISKNGHQLHSSSSLDLMEIVFPPIFGAYMCSPIGTTFRYGPKTGIHCVTTNICCSQQGRSQNGRTTCVKAC